VFATRTATRSGLLLRCYCRYHRPVIVAGALEQTPSSWLVVATTRKGELVYEAGWRHRAADDTTRTMKRRIGPAWLEWSTDGPRRRRGRVRPGFLDEHAAIVAKDKVVREVEGILLRQEAEAGRAKDAPATFRDISAAYLDWLERVKGAKPATLRDHRYLLAEPDAAHRRGKGVHAGAIIAALGNRPAVDVTTREVNRLLDTVAARSASPRTVNKHRQLICAIYNYASSTATFELEQNPAAGADRRPEPERARLDYYSPAEVEILASALADGTHRDPDAPAVDPSEAEARSREDLQDAELIRVAAYTGLRRGELLALRWRDVELEQRKVIVSRAISADQEATSTKSRKAREVPIPDQAAVALRRLRERGDFRASDDFVFTNRLGRRLDGSALRRRVARARDAAGLRKLRFHDLRHTYGSLLVAAGVDLASVKSAMGHSRITTTERYLHARSASELAERFTQAFAPT
jgi:integrase